MKESAQDLASDLQAVMAFVLRMRARGIVDVNIVRAIETLPRRLFVPHIYADLAWRDMALPIACGQTMPEAFEVARMMDALRPERHHRVLEIGTGSGYTTAVLAQLSVEVVSFEFFATLATEAAARLKKLNVANASILHDDGLQPSVKMERFDRILLDGTLEVLPDTLHEWLTDDGIVVYAVQPPGQAAQRARAERIGPGWRETLLGPCRASPIFTLK